MLYSQILQPSKNCLYLSPRQLRKTSDSEKSYYALTRKYVKKAHTFCPHNN